MQEKINKIYGPILILGASGFVGANLLKLLLKYRKDVYGTFLNMQPWRLVQLPSENIIKVNLLREDELNRLFNRVKPKTVFNCVAYGAYSSETNHDLICQTNFNLTGKILDRLENKSISCYVHSGTSSEYGEHSSAPLENEIPEPNSYYAVTKLASANLIHYFGKKKNMPCVNLRFYSAYGPLEDSSRLIPNLIRCGIEKKYPVFVDPEISRDFVYIDDICSAFIDTSLNLPSSHYGESFNIGSGKKTTIREVAFIAKKLFEINENPVFDTMPNRQWDVKDWYANAEKAKKIIGWTPKINFVEGLNKTINWYRELKNKEEYYQSSVLFLKNK